MDGNRRWAKKQGLSTYDGHKAGFEKFKQVVEWAHKAGVKDLIFYAFSSENWKRGKEEVAGLLQLFMTATKERNLLKKNNIKIKFIGDRNLFPKKLQILLSNMEEYTKDYVKGTITIALSYGGRAEILQAVNKAIKEGKELEKEEDFASYLWTKDIPDPDLIIRTGGSMRISNFLPWQSVYSELYFSKTYWPDFKKQEFECILNEFNKTERRFGT